MDVLVSAGPVCDASGRATGALVAIQDVTDLAALQRQVDSKDRQLAVGEMTAGLIHDFNNVLNTISQAVTVLDSNQHRSEHDRTLLTIIQNAVHHGAETVGNIREYLVGSNRKRSAIDVRALLEEVLELAHPILKGHVGVRLKRRMNSCHEVCANPDELRRAFINLLLNALDAMPSGGTLTVSCTETAGNVVVSVQDTGTGIPLKVQKKIFSPFFITKAKGTGLGLAGARRAVLAQGGEIRFESSPGRGTTFYVTLPVSRGETDLHPQAA
jgi:signal transduction histidine kinase